MARTEKISLLVNILWIGLAVAVIFHGLMGAILHLGYPYNTFLFRADDRFMDFFNPVRGSSDLDPYNPDRIHFIGGYLPFGYLVSFLFSLIRPWEVSFTIFVAGFIAYMIGYIKANLYNEQSLQTKQWSHVLVLSLLTYPVIFILDRSNFDIVLFIFVSLFVFFYQEKRTTLATLLLAIPIAMKGYPAILLTIPFLDRRIRDIFLCGLLVAALEVISLSVFKDGLLLELGKMIASFGNAYSIAFESASLVRFNSSLYTLLLFLNPNWTLTPWFAPAYLIFIIISYAVVVFFILRGNYPFWQRLTLITVLMILLPQSSGDYRLLMLYPALLAFVNNQVATTLDRTIIWLFGVIFIPQAYLILQSDVNIGIILHPISLALLLLAFILPFENKRAFLGVSESFGSHSITGTE